MDIDLARYLGLPIERLLEAAPIRDWPVTRSAEPAEPDEMDPLEAERSYAFEAHGLEVKCDARDHIETMFCRHGDAEPLIGISFALTRAQVRERFGAPERTGDEMQHRLFGYRGPWDRFRFPTHALHFEYTRGEQSIEMITLMRLDRVPR
jgi:hypothetical protein